MFYVYALLDLRKPGSFLYRESQLFEYEPFYVGKGNGNRINEHDGEIHSKSRTRKANKIRKIFKETGQLHLKVKLFENLTEEQAFEFEIFMIKQIGRIDHKRGPLTNHTDGGEGDSGRVFSEDHRRHLSESHIGKTQSEETKQKISEVNIGKHLPEETRRKMSESRSGEKNYIFGKYLSEETRRKISEKNTGKHHSEETRKKMSEAQTGEKNYSFGKHRSEEHKKRISEALSREKNPFFGRQHSEESKKKMSSSMKKYCQNKKLKCLGDKI